MEHMFFVRLPIDRHLGGFHILAIVDNAHVQISFLRVVFFSFG